MIAQPIKSTDKRKSNSMEGEVTGDTSTPYVSWADYVKAVEAGTEIQPDEPKLVRRPQYEFNVDKALDTIDLTFNGYVPSKDAINFFNVIRLVLGEEPEKSNSLMHYFLVDLVFGNIKRENYPYSQEINNKILIDQERIAIIAGRMSAKSTIITAYLPIYVAVTGSVPNFGPLMFIVGFGDSQQAGAKVQANTIRDFCADSEFCKGYFEKMRFTDEECEFIRKGTEPVKKRAFMYKVKGAAGGSVRGIRYRTARPDAFIFDDIIKSEAEASSPVIMKKLHSMIYADAENALGSKGFIIAVNTPFNKKDPIYSALESGIWTPICLPLCQAISLDLKKEDYVSSWPSVHSYEKTMKRYTNAYYGGTLREFNQELMLRISSEEDKMIKENMIQWFSRGSVMKVLENFTVLITTDFTASSVTKGGDNSGIAVWAIGADDDKYLVDLELKNQTIQEQYDALFRMVSKWGKGGRVLEVGIEVDGQQKLNLFALKQMMIEKGIWFRFARQKGSASSSEGILSRAAGGNKHLRFKYMMPSFERHKMHFAEELKNSPDMIEMLEELNYVTFEAIGSKKDDGLDLISQVGMIEYILPTNGTELEAEGGLTEASKRIWGDIWDGDDKDSRGSEIF